jgi:hypothetical protein
MKNKIIILLSLIILLLSADYALGADTAVKNGDYIKATCTCTCQNKPLASSALYKPVALIDLLANQEAIALCQAQCARSCGGLTTCKNQNDAGCTECCSGYCSNSAEGYTGTFGTSCTPSCKSSCTYMGQVQGATELVYMVAGVIAALMIVIHGIRMLTTDDPHERNAAKKSIIYVILALIVIIMAGIIAGLFLKPGAIA